MINKKPHGGIGNKNAVGNRGNKRAKGVPEKPYNVKLSECISIRVTNQEKQDFVDKIKKSGTKPRQVILDFIKKH